MKGKLPFSISVFAKISFKHEGRQYKDVYRKSRIEEVYSKSALKETPKGFLQANGRLSQLVTQKRKEK